MHSKITEHQNKILRFLIASIILIYLLFIFFSWGILRDKPPNLSANLVSQAEVSAQKLSTPMLDNTVAHAPVKVYTGIYLEDVQNVSIKESYWTTTFYVWFSWKGDKSLDPGKSFGLVSAQIQKKELQDSFSSPDGTNYECYKIVARMTKIFSTLHIPLDAHTLDIEIEDGALDSSKLVYVVDPSSSINPDLALHDYKIEGFSQASVSHIYPTKFGDPRLGNQNHSSYSKYIYEVKFQRIGLGFYFKLFLGMFAGVFLTLASFFIRPAEIAPRYGIPPISYFGAIGNAYIVNALLPQTSRYGLADLVTGLGLFTISFCIVITITSGYFWFQKDDKAFSKAIDKAAWKTFGLCFLIANIALVVMALN